MLWFRSLFPLSLTRFSFHFFMNAWVPPEFEILRTCSTSKHLSHSQSANWKFHSTTRMHICPLFYRKQPLDGLFQTDSPVSSFPEYPQREPTFCSKKQRKVCWSSLRSLRWRCESWTRQGQGRVRSLSGNKTDQKPRVGSGRGMERGRRFSLLDVLIGGNVSFQKSRETTDGNGQEDPIVTVPSCHTKFIFLLQIMGEQWQFLNLTVVTKSVSGESQEGCWRAQSDRLQQ